MTDEGLAAWQQQLLHALANGDLTLLHEEGVLDPELRRYLEGFDPDASALAVELWRTWGQRTPDPAR